MLESIFFGVINIETPAHFTKNLYYGVLLEALEALIGPDLLLVKDKVRSIQFDFSSVPILPPMTTFSCDCKPESIALPYYKRFLEFAESYGFHAYYLNAKSQPLVDCSNFLTVLLHYEGHCICCISMLTSDLPWEIVCLHPDMLTDTADILRLDAILGALVPDFFPAVGPQFIRFRNVRSCNDEDIVRF